MIVWPSWSYQCNDLVCYFCLSWCPFYARKFWLVKWTELNTPAKMTLEFLLVYTCLATISLNPCLCPWLLNRSLCSWSNMTVWLTFSCNYEGSTFCYVILRPRVLFPGFDYATLCAAIQWPISLADMLAVNWLCVEWQLSCKSIMSLLNLFERVKKKDM